MKDRKIKVNNMPDDVREFIVARIDGRDCSLWYWGSWDNKEEAVHAAIDVDGIVVNREECE